MNNTIFKLNKVQIKCIKNECEQEDYHGHYEGGCLCGYYEFYIENVGFITINIHCRKTSECPDKMNWFVEDIVSVWSNSLCSYGYIPKEDEIDARKCFLGYLDKESSAIVKTIVRDDITENYSYNKTDEFGKEFTSSMSYIKDEERNSNYDYERAYEALLGYLVDLKASCINCGTDKSHCEACKQGTQMWSFNDELIDELDQIENFRIK